MSHPIRANTEVSTRTTGSIRPGIRINRTRGFTLLELMCSAALVGLLAAIAVPAYNGVVDKQKVGVAKNDLMQLSLAIERYRNANHYELPASLDELPGGAGKDPWGNPYRYLNFNSDVPGVTGQIRKDHNLHPLNSEFDLYSSGPDGESRAPLTASASRDDVIWARDGAFIGPASEF